MPEGRIKIFEDIFIDRYIKKLTLKQIGDKNGTSKQNIHQKINSKFFIQLFASLKEKYDV